MVVSKPIQVQQYADNSYSNTDDSQYWDNMAELAVFQEPGVISSVAFSPKDPFHLAATNSNRASLFDTSIGQPVWFQSRFRSNVFGLKIRPDGELLGMGSVDGYVHFFDVTKKGIPSRNAVRVFQAHTCEVRCLAFQSKSSRCATFGDDGMFKVWDLALSKADEPFYSVPNAHADRIRACASSQKDANMFVSGGYDHIVKTWDVRQAPENACVINMSHDAPVESLLLMPNNRIVISSGGNTVKFWDLTAGGRLMHSLENHNRTVTSLAFSHDKKYLLTGGLDRRIHVFRIDQGQFSLVHTYSTAAPVLYMDVSKNDGCLAFGMNNLLSIYRRKPKQEIAATSRPTSASVRKLNAVVHKEGAAEPSSADVTSKHVYQIHLGRLDVLLRGCQYRKAVDQVMQDKKTRDQKPDLVVAALDQLRIRGVLHSALSGRQGNQLKQLLGFVSTHFFRPAFSNVLYDVATALFEIYVEEELSRAELAAMKDLRNQIRAEISCEQSMLRCWGVIESLLSSSVRAKMDDDGVSNGGESDVFGEMTITPKPFSLQDVKCNGTTEKNDVSCQVVD